MFSFRRDKMGFFNGLILIIIATATAISTVLILAIGGWEANKTAIKIIWGTAWVLCIIAVLVRIAVFKYQRDRVGGRERAEQEQPRSGDEPGSDRDSSASPPRPAPQQ